MCIENNSVFDLLLRDIHSWKETATGSTKQVILVVWLQENLFFLINKNVLSSELFLWYNPYEKVIDYITHIAQNQE